MRPRSTDTALTAVRLVWADASDRGLFDGIDDEVLADIAATWHEAVLKALLSPTVDGFPPGTSLLEKVRS